MDNKDVKIRRATLSDFRKIQELNQLLFHSDFQFDKTLKLDWPKSREGINYFKTSINSKKSCVFVADIENQIVGYLIGADLGIQKDRNMGKLGELESIFILEKYRNFNIGSNLIGKFLNWCKRREIKKVRVEAYAKSEYTIKFYKKNKFVERDLILERGI